MNKDVIYIEPEDDITDIITKIEKAKEKIVAIVPPKKAGVFRSVVNIKLITKSGAAAEKTVVLVTTDPSIVKLAAATKLPVTKDLQTAPVIPKAEVEAEEKAELVEESDGTVETKEDVEELSKPKEADNKDDEEGTNDDEKDDEKDDDKTKKASKKTPNKFIAWIKEHKKLAILCGIGIVALILLLIWALVIAPAATIAVGVRTTSNNFSENVTFTTKMNEENASEGKFYLDEKKVEDIKEVEFEATGKKNVGEKATGEVTVIATVSSDGGTVQVKSGDVFTNGGLKYIADSGVTMAFDGKDKSVCGNVDDNTTVKEFDAQGCKIYAKVKVTAAEPGSQYNISARDNGWNTTAPVAAYSTNAMSGGTDKELTVVQQSDILKAKETLAAADEEANKEKLLASVSGDALAIDASFKQTTADAVSTPNVGEEVPEGSKAKLKAVTTATIYVVDKTKLAEFITEKANLSDDQKIYEMKDPFIENFSETSNGYTGKLKTSYLTGPKLSVSNIVEMVRGKGLGDAQHTLKDIDGVIEVKTEGSFPWVTAVPNNTNKITVNLEIKDQNGNKVEQKEDKDTDENKQNEEKGTENH